MKHPDLTENPAPSHSYLMPHELIHAVWALAFRHIRLLALRPIQLCLRFVERIEARAHRIFQRAYVAARMQHFPRMRAFTSFASLEHDEQGVQSGNDLWHVCG